MPDTPLLFSSVRLVGFIHTSFPHLSRHALLVWLAIAATVCVVSGGVEPAVPHAVIHQDEHGIAAAPSPSSLHQYSNGRRTCQLTCPAMQTLTAQMNSDVLRDDSPQQDEEEEEEKKKKEEKKEERKEEEELATSRVLTEGGRKSGDTSSMARKVCGGGSPSTSSGSSKRQLTILDGMVGNGMVGNGMVGNGLVGNGLGMANKLTQQFRKPAVHSALQIPMACSISFPILYWMWHGQRAISEKVFWWQWGLFTASLAYNIARAYRQHMDYDSKAMMLLVGVAFPLAIIMDRYVITQWPSKSKSRNPNQEDSCPSTRGRSNTARARKERSAGGTSC
eukprot:GHVQ01002226.1.p1 GENE.GHVQ01002226.1~~GHVQ01002226.1.p1  ORF type:complete len:383 (+),score=62.62 GHVQ01002226.1:146-1150(+)